MKTVVLLPAYLRAKVTLIEYESKPTKLSQEAAASAKAQKEIKRVPEADRVLIRHISAIRIIRPHASSLVGRSYAPPRFQVPVDGFWRQFMDPERVGHDAAGNEIKGREQFAQHTRYRDNPALDAPKIVYLKSSLSSAKKRLENWRRAHSMPNQGRTAVGATSPAEHFRGPSGSRPYLAFGKRRDAQRMQRTHRRVRLRHAMPGSRRRHLQSRVQRQGPGNACTRALRSNCKPREIPAGAGVGGH